MSFSIFTVIFTKKDSKKTSNSTTIWNDKVKIVLNRSVFDKIIKILEKYKNDNIITFVLERLDKDDLKNYFNDGKVIFFARLYECDLVNILQSIVLELSDIVIGAMEIYNKRVEDIVLQVLQLLQIS